ncbi:MAG: chain-length determining protein, partial [Prevotella sp.]
MEDKKELEVIDLRVVFKKIYERRRLFYKVLPIVFVLSCAFILCLPRYYRSSLSLAPEIGGSSGLGGTLGSLASSFGIDLGSMETTDAINPMLYPDLMEDNGFVVGLFDIKVKSLDGEINCSYYDYLLKHQKRPFWQYAFLWVKKLLPKDEVIRNKGNKLNPYLLSKRQDDICKIIREKVSISVDK